MFNPLLRIIRSSLDCDPYYHICTYMYTHTHARNIKRYTYSTARTLFIIISHAHTGTEVVPTHVVFHFADL